MVCLAGFKQQSQPLQLQCLLQLTCYALVGLLLMLHLTIPALRKSHPTHILHASQNEVLPTTEQFPCHRLMLCCRALKLFLIPVIIEACCVERCLLLGLAGDLPGLYPYNTTDEAEETADQVCCDVHILPHCCLVL